MKNAFKILLAVFVLLNGNEIKSAPFDTGMITLKQPNNVTFTGRIWGDEFIYWMETENGYRFVESYEEGWYYYATLDQDGEYTATSYKVGIDSPPASSYKLERSQSRLNEIAEQMEQFSEQIELNRQWFAQKQVEAHEQPVTLQVGIILIEFTDVKHYKTTEPPNNRPNGYFTVDFDSMMFSNNYWNDAQRHPEEEEIFGSFRDYWHQMSCGKLRIEGRVANPTDENGVPEWLTAAYSKEYYFNLNAGNEWDSLANEAIFKAIDAGYVDTINKNSPNYFDKLVVVYADIVKWDGALKVMGHTEGGKYIFLAERSSYKLWHGEDWSFTHIGIYAHEFGHNLGFWDEYENESPLPLDYPPTNGWPTDIYNFCLMAFGIYNGPLSKGECPATLSAYYRIDKNWVTPTVIPSDTTNFIVEYNYNNPNYYRINPVDATNDEHFILENKKRTGFDLYIPGDPADSVNQAGRLLVWHHLVDLRFFGYTEDFDRITITPADDSFDKLTQLKDFFPKQPNLQNLSDVTTPGAMLGGRINDYQSNERPAHFALDGIQKLANGNTLINEIKLNLNLAPDPITISKNYNGGWDLVSVPVRSFNNFSSLIFPTASPVYKFSGGYQLVFALENGPGYWAKFNQPTQTVVFEGIPISSMTIPVVAGWNLIGSISYRLPVPMIYSEPPGIITEKYKYVQGFGNINLTPSDSLKPGSGYWFKTNSTGNIILDINAIPHEMEEIELSNSDKFVVTDADGNSQTLFVSNIDIDTSLASLNAEMPPVFPELSFDSRFEYGELVKKVSADSGLIDINILVQANSFPVNLSWDINPENGINYSFIGDSIIGKVSNILAESGITSFPQLNNSRIQLLAKVDGSSSKNLIPKEYNLSQNYPNPFNPVTTIKYDLPNTSDVSLIIYDILGRKVKELVNTKQQAGRYEIQFNASNLASGVYIYQLIAEKYISSRKMILLK